MKNKEFYMKHKRFYICLLILFCTMSWRSLAQEMPDEIRAIVSNAGENYLVGVGSAKTESDGESILLAE